MFFALSSIRQTIFLSIACLLFFTGIPNVRAQIIQASIQQIKSSKNISYTDIVRTKFSFQEDFVADTLSSYIMPVGKESQTGGCYLIKARNHAYAFDGSKLISLNLEDSTYKIQQESVSGQNTRSLLYWTNVLQKSVNQPDQVRLLPDTLIDNIFYAHVKIIDYDSIAHNERVYLITDFVVDKKAKLPFQINRQMRGLTDDGSILSLIENHNYSTYRLNQRDFPDLSVAKIPDYFKLYVRGIPVKPLPNGTLAPPLTMHDLTGNELQLTHFREKFVLLDFSLIGCPHSAAAVQMLNRLHDKYGNQLAILNIYPNDPSEVIQQFDEREKVRTTSVTCKKTAQQDFPINGYPSFYLLDGDGVVVQSYSGFFKDLESLLIDDIESL